ncbi:hypothetical protein GCM10025867_19160 [Frondihabitans sucicola]|uniref:Uncharacterized protein n=1 Tax=Frondihabitans sucicola TaxID=1268041 RepID=A0ABM8GMN4_9MICO|nr:hypothetical protein GCM10025867_19160 [Frondihabitans sucicola]
MPLARLEELEGDVDGLGLDVFGQGDRHGARLGGVGQHAQGSESDREELLGAVDAVEEARQRPERVGDLDARVVRLLDLLQDRVGHAGRERVAREQQDRQAVGRRQGGSGQQVRGTGPDGRGRGVGRAAAVQAGEADALVDHGLLVTRLVVGHETRLRVVDLLERLADAGDVAVPEDAEHPRDRTFADVAVDGPLVRQELDQSLADGHALGTGFFGAGARCRHRRLPFGVSSV